jgi:TetR/AcrR family transcriptional regulator, mexJK operon transcriptional repressor
MTHRSDLKRDAILDAGTRMFLAHGYSAVSMDAIAEAAPVSKPTLYNYFTGKTALFEAVINRLCITLLHSLDRLQADAADLATGLTLISRASVDLIYAPESLQLFRVIIAEQTNFPELGKLAYQAGAEPLTHHIADFLERVDSSEVAFPDVMQSARLLLSMLMGDEHLRCLMGVQPPLTVTERERLVTRVVHTYLKAHATR